MKKKTQRPVMQSDSETPRVYIANFPSLSKEHTDLLATDWGTMENFQSRGMC